MHLLTSLQGEIMGRRRNKEGGIEILFMLHWSVNFGLGVLCFLCLKFIFPSILEARPMLAALAILSRSVAWLPLVFFWFIVVVQFFRSKKFLDPTTVQWEKRSPHLYEAAKAKVQTPIDNTWGNGKINQPNAVPPTFQAWSVDALKSIEWKRFEMLCAKYYEAVGFRSETLSSGADGGIDVKLFKVDPSKPIAIVQCKAWNSQQVGVKEIRELLGVMTHEKVQRGIFITTSAYTKDALNFVTTNPIQLLDAGGFVDKLLQLKSEKQIELMTWAFAGDYSTPTCATCGIKMVRRESKKGKFWGCQSYPRCRNKIYIKV